MSTKIDIGGYMDTVKIYNARDEIEANMIVSALEAENIPCHSIQSGSGDWMKMTQGFSVYGIDLYVNEKDEDLAKTIIEAMISEIDEINLTNEAFDELIEDGLANIEDVDEDGTLNEGIVTSDSDWEKELSRTPWYKNKGLLARIYLGICVALILYMVYMSIRY